MKMWRQGDVLIVTTCEVEKGTDASENGRLILAHGEATGHAHEVVTDAPAKLIESVNGNRYLCLSGPATVTHQEHGAVKLPAGDYRVIRQQEWTDANEPVQVRD